MQIKSLRKISRYAQVDSNVLTDGRNFYDQPINDQIKNYDEIRKIATGKLYKR